MAKITRFSGDLQAFASNPTVATERTIFGSTAQSDLLTANVTTEFLRGWGNVSSTEPPSKQDFNAVSYTSTLLLAYLHQMGVAEWDTLQEYHTGSAVIKTSDLYISKSDTNVGNNPATDTTNWKRLVSNEEAVPAGAVQYYAMTSPPTGWIVCDGSLVLRSTYAALWSAIGTTFGAGDGTTTFGVPDLRGKFIRGFDDGAGVDPLRAFGSSQIDAMQSHSHFTGVKAKYNNERAAYTNTGSVSGALSGIRVAAGSNETSGVYCGLTGDIISSGAAIAETQAGSTTSANAAKAETRPKNVALTACIKY